MGAGDHRRKFLPRRLRPTLPPRELHGAPLNVDLLRGHHITAPRGFERPVRADLVVATTELLERFARLGGTAVELPVHLFGFERLVKSLQEPELRRRAVLDAHVRVLPGNVRLEVPRQKARAIVGHQKRHLRQWPVQPLGLGTGRIERDSDLARALARREVTGQKISGVVVNHRHRVPPAVTGNVQVRHVSLPQLVRPRRQEFKQPRRLINRNIPHPRLLQKIRRLEDAIDLRVGDAQTFAPPEDRNAFVPPPRITVRERLDRRDQPGVERPGLAARARATLRSSHIPARAGNPQPTQHPVQSHRGLEVGFDRFAHHHSQLLAEFYWPESFFKMRFAMVISPITWSRSASCPSSFAISLLCSSSLPRPASPAAPPCKNSSRHRYSVCSEIPARRAICAAGSSLHSSLSTSCVRCSTVNSDFFPIAYPPNFWYHFTSCPENPELYIRRPGPTTPVAVPLAPDPGTELMSEHLKKLWRGT